MKNFIFLQNTKLLENNANEGKITHFEVQIKHNKLCRSIASHREPLLFRFLVVENDLVNCEMCYLSTRNLVFFFAVVVVFVEKATRLSSQEFSVFLYYFDNEENQKTGKWRSRFKRVELILSLRILA